MNIKKIVFLFIIIIIIIILVYKNINLVGINNLVRQALYINNGMYKIIYSMKYINININNIPYVLKDKIDIINVKTGFNNKKINKINLIKKVIDSIDSLRYNTTNINVIDYLDTKTKYYFSPHTDTEWNLIKNDGYQVWLFLKNNNKNNYGNMFIVYNKYLFDKYKNEYYYLLERNGKIFVYKNCKYTDFTNIFSKDSYLLEILEIDWFIQNTQLFYLDFKENDCLILNKNICHMSDIRGSNNRYAVNFRVVIDDIKYHNNSCGYVNNKNIIYSQ